MGCQLIRFGRERATLGPTEDPVIDQFEWLELTVGRFLAPAAYDDETKSVVYVLPSQDAAPEQDRLEAEIGAFGVMLERLREHLVDLITDGPGPVEALLSLQALVELRLPDPEWERGFHFCDGTLVLTGWGLEEGVRLGDMLAPGAEGEGAKYLAAIARWFEMSDAREPESAQRNDAPMPDVGELRPKKQGRGLFRSLFKSKR